VAQARLVLVAACALIDPDARVLIARRPVWKAMAGLWEFPGGKVESGERPEEALIRELREELGIVVKEACLAPFTFASHAYPEFHLLIPLYVCRKWEGQPRPHEHQEIKWVRPRCLSDYPMPPADLPIIPMLRDLLSDSFPAIRVASPPSNTP
jgi:8-oxo-dGTP diphosphatase